MKLVELHVFLIHEDDKDPTKSTDETAHEIMDFLGTRAGLRDRFPHVTPLYAMFDVTNEGEPRKWNPS